MRKNEMIYRAIGGISDDKAADAYLYTSEKQKNYRLRNVLYGIGVAALICSFFVLSFVLLKVSGPKTDPAAVGTDTGTEQVTETETETKIETETRDPSYLDDEFFKKLYDDIYKNLEDGKINPIYEVSVEETTVNLNDLPGVEALELKEITPVETAEKILGKYVFSFGSGITHFIWTFKTDEEYGGISANRSIDENGNVAYEFSSESLGMFKVSVLRNALKKGGLSEGKKAEYEAMLSELSSKYVPTDEEICKLAVGLAQTYCGYEVPLIIDRDYANALSDTVLRASRDFRANKNVNTGNETTAESNIIDEYIEKVFSHKGTTELPRKLKDKLADGPGNNTGISNDDIFIYPIYKAATTGPIETYALNYGYSGYPDCLSVDSVITEIDIMRDDINICGINTSSSFEEFEKVFTELGFEVQKASDYRIFAKIDGFTITLQKEEKISSGYVIHNSLCLRLAVTNNNGVIF